MRASRRLAFAFVCVALSSSAGTAWADPPVTRQQVETLLSDFESAPSQTSLRGLGTSAIDQLLQLSNDANAPLFVRARAVHALRVFNQGASSTTVHAALRAVAGSSTADTLLRRAALDALAEGFSDVTTVRGYLGATDPSMREAAGWTLSRMSDPTARAAVQAQLAREHDPAVQESLRSALGLRTPTPSVPTTPTTPTPRTRG